MTAPYVKNTITNLKDNMRRNCSTFYYNQKKTNVIFIITSHLGLVDGKLSNSEIVESFLFHTTISLIIIFSTSEFCVMAINITLDRDLPLSIAFHVILSMDFSS